MGDFLWVALQLTNSLFEVSIDTIHEFFHEQHNIEENRDTLDIMTFDI